MFKIGDRVRYIGGFCLIKIKPDEDEGTVVIVDGDSVGVEWDRNVDGHDCDGLCKSGHGWYIGKESVKLVGRKSEGRAVVESIKEEVEILRSF